MHRVLLTNYCALIHWLKDKITAATPHDSKQKQDRETDAKRQVLLCLLHCIAIPSQWYKPKAEQLKSPLHEDGNPTSHKTHAFPYNVIRILMVTFIKTCRQIEFISLLITFRQKFICSNNFLLTTNRCPSQNPNRVVLDNYLYIQQKSG